MSSLDAAAHSFWIWFVKARTEIERAIEQSQTGDIVRLLNPQIAAPSERIGWEVGPGLDKEFSLALTLHGDLDNLVIANAILSNSPTLPNWEFHAGRPPKPGWSYQFKMRNTAGQEVDIDAHDWNYHLVGFDNMTFFDITLVSTNLPRMDEVATRQAAMIAIEGAIGELMMLERIDRIDVSRTVPLEKQSQLSPLLRLRDHLALLTTA